MSERYLTAGEIALARSVYGDAIDYSKVTVSDKSLFGPMIDESRAHTPFGTMHFPGQSYSADFSMERVTNFGYLPSQRTFIHEMAHVLQYQQGENVALKSVFNRNYDYGQVFSGVKFGSLGTEQRAEMIEDYFALTQGEPAHTLSNTSRQPIGEYEKRLPPYIVTSPKLPDQAPIPDRINGARDGQSGAAGGRGGSEFGGNSAAGGDNTSGVGGGFSNPSQSSADARASDRASSPSAGSSSGGWMSTPSTAPTPTSPDSNYAPGAITRSPLAPPTASEPAVGHYESENGTWHWVGKPEDEPGYKLHINLPDPWVDTITTNSIHPMGVPGNNGGSDHTSSGSGSGGLGNSVHGTPAVGDHAGHPNGVSGSAGNGWNGHPVLLDLSGNGLSINPLYESSQFLDLEGDSYQHRAAWAGTGTGVLVLDADGDGKISRSSEFVFTEWDQTADSDLDALKSVFDTKSQWDARFRRRTLVGIQDHGRRPTRFVGFPRYRLDQLDGDRQWAAVR